MKFFKTEELHDLRIILKSGGTIITKRVRDWKFSPTSYKVVWANVKDANIATLNPEQVEAVEILKRRTNIIWG